MTSCTTLKRVGRGEIQRLTAGFSSAGPVNRPQDIIIHTRASIGNIRSNAPPNIFFQDELKLRADQKVQQTSDAPVILENPNHSGEPVLTPLKIGHNRFGILLYSSR